MQWLTHATTLTYPRLQVMYDVHGEASLPESTVDGLDGYRRSRPVRTGNAASSQFQLDVYALSLKASERAHHSIVSLSDPPRGATSSRSSR